MGRTPKADHPLTHLVTRPGGMGASVAAPTHTRPSIVPSGWGRLGEGPPNRVHVRSEPHLNVPPGALPPPLGGAASLAGGRRAFVYAPPPPPEGGVMEGGGGGVSAVWCGVLWQGLSRMVWYGMVRHDGGVLWYGMV